MDCTYKANRYKMSLIDLSVLSSFSITFYSCFVFIENERGDDYLWALEIFYILGFKLQPIVIVYDRELALMKTISV